MDWSDLGKKIIGIGAPLLGGTLGGPGGAAVGGLIARTVGANADDPEDISAKIKADPEALVKLRAIELQHKEKFEELAVKRAQIAAESELSTIRAVNETMRSEAKSEHWPQYSWRPFNGFAFPCAVLAIYFILPLSNRAVPAVPQWVWMGWLSILGVATWHRGKEKSYQVAGGQVEQKRTGIIETTINAIRGQK